MNTLQFSRQKKNKKKELKILIYSMLYRFLARYELVSKLARLNV